jgi:LacI family transcriptional regulator
MSGKVKFVDIARQSGVSISTVSLVLNNKPGVSEETRQRVFEIAEQIGYTIKLNAVAAKKNHLTTVGMVVKTDPDIPPQANPFYSKVIVGIENACRRSGVNLLFATLPVDENNHPREVPSLLNHEGIEGLLLVGTFVDSTITSITNKHTPPIVLVDGYSNTESYDTVISDNFRAAYQAVQFLIDKGHRKIGLAGSDPNCYPSLMERRNGYVRAVKENNLLDTFTANFNINRSKGCEEILQLLKGYPDITALFCVNDDAASSAIRAAQILGRRVPEDLSVIGYDDTYIAANTHPPLTTMHVDTVAMGCAAVHLLSLRLENRDFARMTLTIHPTLVERESVAYARTQSPALASSNE